MISGYTGWILLWVVAAAVVWWAAGKLYDSGLDRQNED